MYRCKIIPRCSMYGIFTYIWAIFGVNASKYSIHGASGIHIDVHFWSADLHLPGFIQPLASPWWVQGMLRAWHSWLRCCFGQSCWEKKAASPKKSKEKHIFQVGSSSENGETPQNGWFLLGKIPLNYLVGGWATPLKNMTSSIGMIRNPILMGK